TKTVTLTEGDSFFDVIYEVGPSTQYVKSGFSPGLVDLIWNAQMNRIWVSDASYMGQRNPNNGATAALILGGGGGGHNFDFSARIMKGDEIYGEGVFEFLLYAGTTTAPDTSGEIAELRALANNLSDTIGPGVVSAVYYPGTDILKINFNQITQYSTFSVTGVSIDDDDDGSAELTLSSGTAVVETADGYSLTLQLTLADAATLEGLSTSSLELMMTANTAYDQASNGNEAVSNADNKLISYGAETMITIDGLIDTGEWDMCTFAVSDSNDSEWTASNEIDGLYVTWDSLFLYVAIDGIVNGNSWLLYFDVDPGSANGETNLTAIDSWERGATFTYAGFECDFQYGCYQHQGIYDSDSFFKIVSATTSSDLSDSIVSAFDANHDNGNAGGSELAIPWDILYGLGPGNVPVHASISIVASICWDPDPDGVLGGDSAPSNISAVLPVIDNAHTFVVDGNGNGKPDLPDRTPPTLVECFISSTSDSLVRVTFSETVDSSSAVNAGNYTVFETAVSSNTIAVTGVELLTGNIVQLTLEQSIGSGYSCAVSYVKDISCYENEIVPGSTIEIEQDPTGTGDDQPVAYPGMLYQNYPNPFNPSTTISFELPGMMRPGGITSAAPVHLAVYDVRGRLVKTLVSGDLTAGPHRVRWDGTNNSGSGVSSGIYFYRIVSGNWSNTKKMVLIR
ncbi:MAG: FlgD immunoglobulin-like domain containing protein, partial [Candidatus Latescibacterota bacterium]